MLWHTSIPPLCKNSVNVTWIRTGKGSDGRKQVATILGWLGQKINAIPPSVCEHPHGKQMCIYARLLTNVTFEKEAVGNSLSESANLR